jgi:hypothetical protein
MATTVNDLVKELIELGATSGVEVRLAQLDREDDASDISITYQAAGGERSPLLAAGVSGLEFWEYRITVRGRDGAAVETESRLVQDYIDALAVNYTIDNFVIQSAYTSSVSDEDRGEIVGDAFQYQYSFNLSLAIGRAS